MASRVLVFLCVVIVIVAVAFAVVAGPSSMKRRIFIAKPPSNRPHKSTRQGTKSDAERPFNNNARVEPTQNERKRRRNTADTATQNKKLNTLSRATTREPEKMKPRTTPTMTTKRETATKTEMQKVQMDAQSTSTTPVHRVKKRLRGRHVASQPSRHSVPPFRPVAPLSVHACTFSSPEWPPCRVVENQRGFIWTTCKACVHNQKLEDGARRKRLASMSTTLRQLRLAVPSQHDVRTMTHAQRHAFAIQQGLDRFDNPFIFVCETGVRALRSRTLGDTQKLLRSLRAWDAAWDVVLLSFKTVDLVTEDARDGYAECKFHDDINTASVPDGLKRIASSTGRPAAYLIHPGYAQKLQEELTRTLQDRRSRDMTAAVAETEAEKEDNDMRALIALFSLLQSQDRWFCTKTSWFAPETWPSHELV